MVYAQQVAFIRANVQSLANYVVSEFNEVEVMHVLIVNVRNFIGK